jgi:tape measure domain-containing protein
LVKAFTFAPVIDGLHEYENQLNSVQTILANTKDQGTNLKQVNGALNQLNKYADKTIYNFGQMTKNVGTFTAAGVDLKTSVASIKGISNLAALSGSSAEQASTAMYQLSQAISAGRVGLQDWNSVVNAGMGGAVFQKSLMRTAENMGALKDGAVQIDKATGKATINGKSFRESIMSKPGEKSWLTGDVLTNTLKQLSGDMTDAQLKAEGFSDAQIKAIQTQSKMALDAATKVKTFSSLWTPQGSLVLVGLRHGSSYWVTLEKPRLFTGLSNAIGGFVKSSANARNKVLGDWKALGGRKLLIDALKQAFHDLAAVVKPIKDAFETYFPAKRGRIFSILPSDLPILPRLLRPVLLQCRNLHKTFRGFFAFRYW